MATAACWPWKRSTEPTRICLAMGFGERARTDLLRQGCDQQRLPSYMAGDGNIGQRKALNMFMDWYGLVMFGIRVAVNFKIQYSQ